MKNVAPKDAEVKRVMFSILAALLVGASTGAPAQVPVNPAAQWGLNSKECSLWRTYGSGRAKTRLGIWPALTGDSTRIFIVYQGAGAAAPNRWAKGHLRTDSGPEMPIDFINFPSTGVGERFVRLELSAATMESAMRSTSWKISGERLREFDFALDGLQGAYPAVQRCISGQLANLGLDEASLARVAEPPTVDLLKYFGPGDYPVVAAELGISGRSQVRLIVLANGKVADCYPKQGSGNAVLDYVTCETFLKEVRFSPARDAAGQPTASTTVVTIAWEMPSDKKKSKAR